MESGFVYHFTNPQQFWTELEDILAVSPASPLSKLDYSLRNYIAFASAYLDEYLNTSAQLDNALFALLDSPLFADHGERMTNNVIDCVNATASSSTLFISLMIILHLGLSNPLSPTSTLIYSQPSTSHSDRSSKVFRAMRKRWTQVVPVLMNCVRDAGIVESASIERVQLGEVTMPAAGWEERVGIAATSVLYEVCRVQRLSPVELATFKEPFIAHLFSLVERTRDAEDETFNYCLIKLIIALNEQFMCALLPPPSPVAQPGLLPPPILPNAVGHIKRSKGEEKHGNFVLETLKKTAGESKTFGENIIFILNRANGTPDSLCVSLLILKILYLLFTTKETQEYFYTNDLCVLVDVFIRELCDLGEESEGLKHTYLRVLHPLLTNTQLRHHPYKRPLLRRVLNALICSASSYRSVDPTTRRLVERSLKGSWCDGLTDESVGEGEKRSSIRSITGSSKDSEGTKVKRGTGWSSGMGRSNSKELVSRTSTLGKAVDRPSSVGSFSLGMREGAGSTLSVNAIAEAEDFGREKAHSRQRPSIEIDSAMVKGKSLPLLPDDESFLRVGSPLSTSIILESPIEAEYSPLDPAPESKGRARSQSMLSPAPIRPDVPFSDSPSISPIPSRSPSTSSLGSSIANVDSVPSISTTSTLPRRRRPPPPPETTSRPRTPSNASLLPPPSPLLPPSPSIDSRYVPLSTTVSQPRRAAPDPPSANSDSLKGISNGLAGSHIS